MNDFEGDSMFDSGKTLNIDGDILIYKPCCIFNEDTEEDFLSIQRNVSAKITEMMAEADCSDYMMFLTTKKNFRDHLIDDYKANRANVERPVHLTDIKKWVSEELNNKFVVQMEADDLLAEYQTEDTILWSLDKDLRQVSGKHLDEGTMEVITITEFGEIRLDIDGKKKKIYFTGYHGLMYQALVGDTADYIIGCGIRKPMVYKSGKKQGQKYTKRVGIGSLKAYELLKGCKTKDEALNIVSTQYQEVYGKSWDVKLEQQMRLLVMITDREGDSIKLWTVDDRDEYLNIKTGEISETRN